MKIVNYLIVFVSCVNLQLKASETDCPLDKPEWRKSNDNRIIEWLLKTKNYCKNSEVEYPSYDGWYHNLAKINMGSVGQPLLQGWAAIRTDLPQAKNWYKAWNQIIAATSACKTAANALSLYFSKQVIDEIFDTKNPSCVTTEPIKPSTFHTAKQLNYASPYIDGGIIYGKSRYYILKQMVSDGTINIKGLLNSEFENGNYDDLNVSIVLRIIWLRWHNHIAKGIRVVCPQWTSKKVFDEARKWTVAVQQRIYAYEWVPLWTNANLGNYTRYDPTVDPQVEKLFQAAVDIPYSIEYMNSPFLGSTIEKKSMSINEDWIRELIKNLTLLPCENILRPNEIKCVQEKFNLPDINHARRVFMLKTFSSWKDFLIKNNLNDSMLFSTFAAEKLQHLDALMGGTLESRHGVGEFFVTVIHDQLRRIRDGDRFWFENILNNLFSCEQVVKINQITFTDVILTVTNIDEDAENNSMFALPLSDNLRLIYSLNATRILKESSHTLFFPGMNFYILPFLVMCLLCIGTLGAAAYFLSRKERKMKNVVQMDENYSAIKLALQDDLQKGYSLFPVMEYVGAQEELKRVIVILKGDIKHLTIQSLSGAVLRVLDFDTDSKTIVKLISLCDEPTLIIQLPHNYDLVLKFESNYLRSGFTAELNAFIEHNNNIEKELITNFNWKSIKSIIATKGHRQMWLEMFFRVAFAQAFKIQHSLHEMLQVDAFVAKQVIHTELTLVEFADSLSMHPENEFVKRLFTLVDQDKNGFISFREFVDLIILFADGSEETKAKLLFDLYDIDGTGLIPAKEFLAMIKSFLEIVGGKVYEVDIQKTLDVMLRSAGIKNRDNFDFNDFKKIIGDDINNLNYAKLNFKLQEHDAKSYLALAKRTIEAMYRKPCDLETRFQSFTQSIDQNQAKTIQPPVQRTRLNTLLLIVELHSEQLFWMIFLTLLIISVFLERAYHLNEKNKLSGLNWHIFGLTRGAMYAMVLTYALFLITMTKNLWTKLRELLDSKYFPFDYLSQIHCYFTHLSAFFTGIHVIGEILIYYKNIFTSDDLACKLNKYLINSETLNIHMMFWLNHIVISGITLALLLIIVYVFAQSCVRQKIYNVFYFTHNLYPMIIMLIIIHGSQSSVPSMYFAMSAPLILFALDIFVSLKRKKIELPVIRAELFPSNVICLVLRRPKNFQFKVGQWVRLAVPQLSRQKFYSVSMSAAPHEPYLRIFVPPINHWARQVHSLFEGPGLGYVAAPVRVLLDGPYGKGAQQWRHFDVVVLVGGGSGVAPFAAVLKDISHAVQVQAYLHCQKVYFIWVTKTQKKFEWIVDLIQETEENDPKHYFSFHLFITQFYEKFDLRTIMLYICEKHYQRMSGKSLFTNLRAVTHFGRPVFPEFFKTIQSLHPTAKHVGVFSSGPKPLSESIDAACIRINSQSDHRFEHHPNKF